MSGYFEETKWIRKKLKKSQKRVSNSCTNGNDSDTFS